MQEQTCLVPKIGIPAMYAGMSGVDDDIQLIRDLVAWTGTNAAQVAAKIGKPNTTINRFANGSAKHRLARDTLTALRREFPRFPGFIAMEGDGPILDDAAYVDVAVMPSYAGMGGGGTGEGDRQIAKLPRRLIEEELRGKPADFELIDVRGDSMMPDFHHGDQILVDRRDRDPVQPGAFAIWDGDAYVVKLIERVPGRRGWYKVFSANDRYSSYEIEEQEATIMGRPVWFARRL